MPGKPLIQLAGKPMVQWVYEAAVASGVSDRVVVATPDDEIIQACRAFGAEATLTLATHPSGTDRLAEVAEKVDAEIYVNLQGDEPLIPPENVRLCANVLRDNPAAEMSSLYVVANADEINAPSAVKVVTDLNGNALYFSRHAIPFERNARVSPVKKHLGIYAFRRGVLQRFPNWPQSPLEIAESLEQLRFLENGVGIAMREGLATPLSVDTAEQAAEVHNILINRQSSVVY